MMLDVKDVQWVVYESDALQVNMGWERNGPYLMDYYVVYHEAAKPPKRFRGERAMWDVMRYCDSIEWGCNIHIYERAMSAKSLS